MLRIHCEAKMAPNVYSLLYLHFQIKEISLCRSQKRKFCIYICIGLVGKLLYFYQVQLDGCFAATLMAVCNFLYWLSDPFFPSFFFYNHSAFDSAEGWTCTERGLVVLVKVCSIEWLGHRIILPEISAFATSPKKRFQDGSPDLLLISSSICSVLKYMTLVCICLSFIISAVILYWQSYCPLVIAPTSCSQ